jgi:hypothetical protein
MADGDVRAAARQQYQEARAHALRAMELEWRDSPPAKVYRAEGAIGSDQQVGRYATRSQGGNVQLDAEINGVRVVTEEAVDPSGNEKMKTRAVASRIAREAAQAGPGTPSWNLVPKGARTWLQGMHVALKQLSTSLRSIAPLSIVPGIAADIKEANDPLKIEEYAEQVIRGEIHPDFLGPILGPKVMQVVEMKLLGIDTMI